MGNPVRPWKHFLTLWERVDMDAQTKMTVDAAKTLRQLRAHRKDIDSRIVYWEGNLKHARLAKRLLEFKGRSRERQERVIRLRPKRRGNYEGRLTKSNAKAAKALESVQQ